jgi:hypothetical protein
MYMVVASPAKALKRMSTSDNPKLVKVPTIPIDVSRTSFIAFVLGLAYVDGKQVNYAIDLREEFIVSRGRSYSSDSRTSGNNCRYHTTEL